jgi:hypothetical protein
VFRQGSLHVVGRARSSLADKVARPCVTRTLRFGHAHIDASEFLPS